MSTLITTPPASAAQGPTTAEQLRQLGWQPQRLMGHMEQVGPIWSRRTADGMHSYGLLAEPRHMNPGGVMHGGALLTLADHAISTVAWESVDRAMCLTVQMDSQFLAAVRPGEFVWSAVSLQRSSKHLVFLRGDLCVGGAALGAPAEATRTVLSAQAIMKVQRPS